MEQTAVNARRQAEMAPFFDLPEGERPDSAGERLEEIFHLD
jgi:L-rhamnose mutarotase